jgi:hypothetical protein
VAGLEVAQLRLDAEELADEVFDVRGERDDEQGALFGAERLGEVAGVDELVAEAGREGAEEFLVESGETRVRGEVFKRKS